MAEPKTRGILGADWTNIVFGILVLATPFFTAEQGFVPVWNSMIVGVIVAGLAIWNMAATRAGRYGQTVGTSTINLLAGLWLIALPFVFVTNTAYRWSTVIEGIVLVIASGYVAYAVGRVRRAVTPGRTA